MSAEPTARQGHAWWASEPCTEFKSALRGITPRYERVVSRGEGPDDLSYPLEGVLDNLVVEGKPGRSNVLVRGARSHRASGERRSPAAPPTANRQRVTARESRQRQHAWRSATSYLRSWQRRSGGSRGLCRRVTASSRGARRPDSRTPFAEAHAGCCNHTGCQRAFHRSRA